MFWDNYVTLDIFLWRLLSDLEAIFVLSILKLGRTRDGGGEVGISLHKAFVEFF